MTQRLGPEDVGDAAKLIVGWLAESTSAVAFTGAGISTESGIPDFRSPGGVWAKNEPVYYDDFMRYEESRYEYWRQKAEAHRDFADAEPNCTHQTLARWEEQGDLRGIVTQNIDGLHQDAGSRNVLELHGTARNIACMDCDWQEPADAWVRFFVEHDKVPLCPACDGRLKHATVSFGQSLPREILQTAIEWASEADLFFAMGSSLVVEPAASLPRLAAENGGRFVILNREETPLDARASLIVNAPLGKLFAAIAEHST
jgi:NAD-dependent deacetylase